jgi:methylmalonyl-CoA mutase cobalamin-binding subunit
MDVDLSSGGVSGYELLADGRRLGESARVGSTRLLRREGVAAEADYRRAGRERGQIFTAMNIGMKDWPETVAAVRSIEEHCLARGVRPPDRYQLIPERRMGLPSSVRREAPGETGPMLWDSGDWWQLGNCAELIQPEVGDNIIGGPASVENTLAALAAGSTYVGCLSQFSWRWPYFDDDVQQIGEVVRACAILATRRDRGVLLDTYLEDGIAGTFEDYASLVGWAGVERWIAGLCGCPLSVSWGGLTADPVTKTVVTLALELGNTERIPAAFVQGDTISYTDDLDQNASICAQDVQYMMLVQARYKTGACALPVPLTEKQRVPTWQEIAQVQVMARRLEQRAHDLAGTVNWPELERRAHNLAAAGALFVDNVRAGLDGLGVDTGDPLQVMLALSRLGAAVIEQLWGVGERSDRFAHGRQPVRPTELVAATVAECARFERAAPAAVPGHVIVVGSTDVHEMAKRVLVRALASAGHSVTDIGVNRDPEDFVAAAVAGRASAIVITTHNGVALTFGGRAAELCAERGVAPLIAMGGVLNEDTTASAAPADVTAQLNDLGIVTPPQVDDLLELLSQTPLSQTPLSQTPMLPTPLATPGHPVTTAGETP